MSLGAKFKRFRERKQLTQTKIGVMLGYNPATASIRIAQYEAGLKYPKESTLKLMEEVFDTPREVFGGDVIEYADMFIEGKITLAEAYRGALERFRLVVKNSWDEACVYKYRGQISFLEKYADYYQIDKYSDQYYINNVFSVFGGLQ